jgi:hypothetical protein
LMKKSLADAQSLMSSPSSSLLHHENINGDAGGDGDGGDVTASGSGCVTPASTPASPSTNHEGMNDQYSIELDSEEEEWEVNEETSQETSKGVKAMTESYEVVVLVPTMSKEEVEEEEGAHHEDEDDEEDHHHHDEPIFDEDVTYDGSVITLQQEEEEYEQGRDIEWKCIEVEGRLFPDIFPNSAYWLHQDGFNVHNTSSHTNIDKIRISFC